MQRINRTDPVSDAATQRLLIALTLSVLMHGIVLSVASGRDSDVNAPHIPAQVALPRIFTLSASLVTDAAAFEAGMNSIPHNDRLGAASHLDTLDPRYYLAEELDVLPTPRSAIGQQRDPAESGKIRLLARVDASGRINSISVFDSDRTEDQNTAALHALRDTAFNAARRNGRPVRSEVVIELAAGTGD
ncbi:MAG: energy transducer TonB [Betaproteobacteria bacterium]|nr:MAG: energy transducer TonB [Betaproteobacteria bacterium]